MVPLLPPTYKGQSRSSLDLDVPGPTLTTTSMASPERYAQPSAGLEPNATPVIVGSSSSTMVTVQPCQTPSSQKPTAKVSSCSGWVSSVVSMGTCSVAPSDCSRPDAVVLGVVAGARRAVTVIGEYGHRLHAESRTANSHLSGASLQDGVRADDVRGVVVGQGDTRRQDRRH